MTVKRRPITIQLSPTLDKDLIAEIDRMPLGNRNTCLRNILRVGFGKKPPQDNVSLKIDELQEYVQQGFEAMPSFLTETIQREIQNALKTIDRALMDTQPMAPIDNVPKLSEREMAQRLAKVKQRNW